MPPLERRVQNLTRASQVALEQARTANSAVITQVSERAARTGAQHRSDLNQITDSSLRISTERMTRLTR